MDAIFVQILGYIAAAFGLGLLVGFLYWRHGRVSMTSGEWAAQVRELAEVRALLDSTVADIRDHEAAAGHAEAELARMRLELNASWRGRDELERDVVDLRDAASRHADEMDSVVLEVQYLRRRLAELRAAGPTKVIEPVA